MKFRELTRGRERPRWLLSPDYRPLNVAAEQQRSAQWLAGETITATACVIGRIIMPEADQLQLERFSDDRCRHFYTEWRWGDERFISWHTPYVDRRRLRLIRTYAGLMRDLVNYDAQRSNIKRDHGPVKVEMGEYSAISDAVLLHQDWQPRAESPPVVRYLATMIGASTRVAQLDAPFAASNFSSEGRWLPKDPEPPMETYEPGSVIRLSKLNPHAAPAEGASMRMVIRTELPLVTAKQPD